ncbi:2-dehydro-3-deoxy-D-gluconate 5-dehydrogenase [Ruegeria meonggei]|uniref:2-dehydro-3-deoxy-D-gluconate 5-dehydrogenase n=2 Tax=Ruegeria meonggei TaxID=1446476 RepID=A0A1X6ZK47_9RHOB|nr:2-dehydro-3-deoxy-D-gluconate 5-dehydrogenase [Ruegeria meonggei]
MRGLPMFDLSGKTALVTGCKRGIGRSMAEALAEAGADIVGVSATLELENSEVEKTVRAFGRAFKAYQCDFRDREAVLQFAAQLSQDGIVPDVLVNNAGTIKRAPAAEHSDEYWDEVIDVNLSAQFILAREIGAAMLKRGSGKIVFTASLLTFQGGITVPGYAASKGGIGQLTKALANEWGGKGISVNAIAPGYVATDNTKALRDDPTRSQAILERIPLGRWGKPDDFAGPAVFLSSPASDYVNGEILVVDGGWMGR